eukprot:m.131614 g.131614  ORF g.131614 m.131614 type:complete len:737 (-) comp13921_c0_seq1:109-2319(-)
MEVQLTPLEYLQVGTTQPHTLKLLPSASGKNSKVVVGDNDGVITCFGVKKNAPVIVFKTLGGPAISHMELINDRIFVSCKREVKGYSKKGKNFFNISTFMTEDIQSMCVRDGHIQVAGEYLYSHYIDNKDKHYYMAADVIRGMAAAPLPATLDTDTRLPRDASPLPVLACADSAIRVLDGSDCILSLDTPSPAHCITHFPHPDARHGYFLVGCSNGFSLIALSRKGAEIVWTMTSPDSAAVTAIKAYDLQGVGVPNVIVGRSDGSVEVFSFEEGPDSTSVEPKLNYRSVCSSAITSIEAGHVSSSTYAEVVVATFSGNVICFSTNPSLQSVDAVTSRQTADILKMNQLRDKIAAVEATLVQRKDTIKTMQTTLTKRTKTKEVAAVQTLPDMDVHTTFELREMHGCYFLSLEFPVSIDKVLLEAIVPMDLLDVDSSDLRINITPCDSTPHSLLATCFCPPNTTRVELKLRSIEGQSGVLRVYAIPADMSPAVAYLQKVDVKPLSLHIRVADGAIDELPNSTTITGDFSIDLANQWVAACFPEVASKPTNPDRVTYHFKSTFLLTRITVEIIPGNIAIHSDNLSSLSIAKEAISKAATTLNVPIDIDDVCVAGSVIGIVQVMTEKIKQQIELLQQIDILRTLKEVALQEGDLSAMSEEYKMILQNEAQIMATHKSRPYYLQRLFGVLSDLFIDMRKAQGAPAKQHMPSLLELFDPYDPDQVANFFLHFAHEFDEAQDV